jgi:hypothetical protein
MKNKRIRSVEMPVLSPNRVQTPKKYFSKKNFTLCIGTKLDFFFDIAKYIFKLAPKFNNIILKKQN